MGGPLTVGARGKLPLLPPLVGGTGWHLIHQKEMVIALSMVALDDLSFVLIS